MVRRKEVQMGSKVKRVKGAETRREEDTGAETNARQIQPKPEPEEWKSQI